ncbi:MAG: SseB family protein [Micrococcales bacterium]
MAFEHEHINPNRFTDSAGVPWEGRELHENNFAGDDGSADAGLIDAITKFQRGDAKNEDVVAAFAKARLLIPLLADLGESEIGEHGHKVDKSAELSIVTVGTPDEQNGLPVFSSVAAMQAWNPMARPVPSDALRVAIAAASENNTRIILDAESSTEFAIRRPAIAAIAQEEMWVHPARDSRVRDEFSRVLEGVAEFLGFELEDCDPQSRLHSAELLLVLKLSEGLTGEKVQELMQALAQRLADSSVIAEHVDSLRVKLA